MLECVQPRIVRLHGATSKHGEVIGLLEKPDSRCNISFVGSGWVQCLAIAEVVRSWTARIV